MAVVVAIDAGTTGVRAIAFDESGRIRTSSYREFTQHFPRPGWVEHDASEIWNAVQAVSADVRRRLDDSGEAIAAIGITNQRETTVVWDKRTGAPVHRALVWQDRRTAQRCRELSEAGHLALVRRRTGLVLDPYFSATKLEWLLTDGGVEPGPDVAFGTIDSWLLWNLTGGAVHATEPGNAGRTLLFDVHDLEWSSELTELFGIPHHLLPEVHATSGRFGITAREAAIGSGIPVSGIAGDQQAALFGQACFSTGMTKNTYGTGSFVLMNVGTACPEPVEGLLTTIAWTLGDTTTYALEGAIFATGAAVQWLRDGLGMIGEAAEIGPLAASVPDSDGVVLVPAFTGLGSPWWDPYARGTLIGITRGTSRAHIARATVEAMAFQTRDVVEAMTVASGARIEVMRADGGASAMELLLQIQADQLGVPVARPMVKETTALGAAYLAGLAEGVWSSLDDVAANWALDVELHPGPGRDVADVAYRRWNRAVERARCWIEG